MLEVGAAIAELYLLGLAKFLCNLCLKCLHIDGLLIVKLVPLDVEKCCAYKLGCSKALVELG